MTDNITDQSEDEVLRSEFSDEVLEAAAFTTHAGAYTQMGLCTLSFCNG